MVGTWSRRPSSASQAFSSVCPAGLKQVRCTRSRSASICSALAKRSAGLLCIALRMIAFSSGVRSGLASSTGLKAHCSMRSSISSSVPPANGCTPVTSW
jgi:hypothetical protein